MKVHYLVYKRQPLDHIMSLLYSIHTFASYFLKIRFYDYSPPMPGSSEWSLPSRFSDKLCIYFVFFLTCCAWIHTICCYSLCSHCNKLVKKHELWNSLLCDFFCPFISSFLGLICYEDFVFIVLLLCTLWMLNSTIRFKECKLMRYLIARKHSWLHLKCR